MDEINQKIEKLQSYISALLVPYKNMVTQIKTLNEQVKVLQEEVNSLKSGKVTRQKMNYADWQMIQGQMREGMTTQDWKDVSKQTGIPLSTARKYATLSAEKVEDLRAESLKLEGEQHEEV